MDPRIFHVLIPGPSDRKLLRNLVVNSSFDLFVIWTKSSQNEVYPWRPTIRDQDRANINVFKLKGLQLESVSYCWTENDPVYVNFLRSTEFQILTVEQKILRKGEICAEICSYDINLGKMQRSVLALIPIGTQISCIAFSPDKEKLFIGSMGRYICLHDLVQQDTKLVAQIDIIPSQCSWHSDSSIIMIANDRSQFQCFDLALCPVANHLQGDHVTSSILFDLSQYIGSQSKLIKIAFSRKPDMETFSQCYAQTDSFLLLYFENGPLGCLRFFSTSGMRGDIHNSGLTVDVIVDKYLLLNQLEKAVNLFVALNWETYGAMCLISLHKIANFVFFRGELNPSCVGLMVKAFQTFSNSLSEETKDEFSDQVFDLKRRFFFFLLRNNIYANAFEIAHDIEDYDLFMDLFNSTKSKSNFENYSAAALNRAVVILHEEECGNGIPSKISECNSESTFSQSSCCGTLVEEKRMGQLQKEKSRHFFKNYVPPLPSLKLKIVNSEMIKINIPKPELHHNLSTVKSSYNVQQQDIVVPTNNHNFDQSKTTHLSGYLKTNVDLSWQMDTAKVPAISNATIAQHIMSRTSITASKLSPSSTKINQQLPQKNSTPSIINLPADFTTRSFSQYRPIFFQHPLVSGNIPSTSISTVAGQHLDYQKSAQRKPSGSILSNSSTTQNATVVNGHNMLGTHPTTVSKDFIGRTAVVEKNKVKFSDTVQVAVVPEIQRKEKSVIPKRNGYSRPTLRNITNPKKELADSLPLCHPNDDYLKDFNPISSGDI